jgi:hypothetical protein
MCDAVGVKRDKPNLQADVIFDTGSRSLVPHERGVHL